MRAHGGKNTGKQNSQPSQLSPLQCHQHVIIVSISMIDERDAPTQHHQNHNEIITLLSHEQTLAFS